MKSKLVLKLCAASLFLVAQAHTFAQEPKSESTAKAPEQAELTEEAQGIAEKLRQSLAPESEAIAMLDDIIEGSHLSAEDGWFPLAKAASSMDWNYVEDRYDADGDGSISSDEFSGTPDDFARLDRDGDGQLNATDLEFKENSLAPSAGLTVFFMGDRDANGKLTKEEFAGMFEMLAGQDKDYLALDELRDQLAPPPTTARDNRPDRPSRSTLVRALKDQEIGSLSSGPAVGELAPNFELTDIQGNSVVLADEIGEKPIVLIFGNFTCGPFRSQAGNIERLYERYSDRAKFFMVYVREAHPKDGWWMLSNQRAGIDMDQPTTFAKRREVAATCQSHLGLALPMLVDTIDDAVGTQYSGMPNRLYLIDQQGRIVFKNGRGPFGFHPRQLEQSLVLLLNQK
ncbi:MAG: deiodinase family protein [Aureliella sp.]